MPTSSARIRSAKGFHSALRKRGEDAVGRICMAALNELMDRAFEEAADRFAEAEYAGVDPLDVDNGGVEIRIEETGPLSRELVAEGDIVEYIEYGTGVYNAAAPREKWFFNENGRDIVHNEFVEVPKPRLKKYRMVYDYEWAYDKKLGDYVSKRIPGSLHKEKLKKPKEISREGEGVWFTRGNPGNHIMAGMEDWLLNNLPEVLKSEAVQTYTKGKR